MKTFEFTYIFQGKGETEEEALQDALDTFVPAPGDPSETKEIFPSWQELKETCMAYLVNDEESRYIDLFVSIVQNFLAKGGDKKQLAKLCKCAPSTVDRWAKKTAEPMTGVRRFAVTQIQKIIENK